VSPPPFLWRGAALLRQRDRPFCCQLWSILDPQLIIDTWDFINKLRTELLAKKKLKDSKELPIFLSSTTGKALHPDSISNLFARKQKTVGIDDASIHHLRSVGATKIVKDIFLMYERSDRALPDDDTMLLIVQQRLGHQSTETSLKYIRIERKSLADKQRSQNLPVITQEERLAQLTREIAIKESKLAKLNADIANTPPPRKNKKI
jgi:hypothetical protein